MDFCDIWTITIIWNGILVCAPVYLQVCLACEATVKINKIFSLFYHNNFDLVLSSTRGSGWRPSQKPRQPRSEECYICLLAYSRKKSPSPPNLEFFLGSPDFFCPSHHRRLMKLGIRIPYARSIVTFSFLPTNSRKKIPLPPQTLNFFWIPPIIFDVPIIVS